MAPDCVRTHSVETRPRGLPTEVLWNCVRRQIPALLVSSARETGEKATQLLASPLGLDTNRSMYRRAAPLMSQCLLAPNGL